MTANLRSSQVNDPSYLTAKGIAKIEAELAHLKQVKRLDITDQLHDAMAGGDSIENSEYLLVQQELALVAGRIRELEYTLCHAELIQPNGSGGIIQLGSTVVVQEEEAEPESYTLVGPAEADPCAGCISNRSPLGRALLDHSVGDEVEIETPDGLMRFRIMSRRPEGMSGTFYSCATTRPS